MSECRKCADLRRQYGFTCQELRNAARKMAYRETAAGFAAIEKAKKAKADATESLNRHVAEEHSNEGVA